MSATEMVEQLKQLSNPERLQVIEAATRLVRQDLLIHTGHVVREDAVLKTAGCLSGVPPLPGEIDKELYDR